MKKLDKLKDIAIQDEPNNVQAIFADDTSVRNLVPAFFSFVLFFLIILTLGIFAPKESEVICSTLSLDSNSNHEDVFNSMVTNISSVNQKFRLSILYDNATLDKELSRPIRTHITVELYDSTGSKLETLSNTDSVRYDRPVPLFQTSAINFEKLVLKASLDTKYDHKHTATLKYEYVSSEASFFQLKVRAILSIISISTFIFMTKTMTRTIAQFMTLFLHVAALFIFNPLQIIFNYFPSVTFLCFDFIFKNVGLAYVYVYSSVIFFSFEQKLSKYAIVSNAFLFVILLLVLLAKDFNSLAESYPTIYPLEFNGYNYNTNRFMSQVKVHGNNKDPDVVFKLTNDLALKLAFLNSTTIEESNLNLREFTFLIVLFFLPVFISIIYSIFNVQDVFFHRILVFAITIAIFAIGMTNFYAIDVVRANFHGRLIRWMIPMASLSTFTLVFTFLNMEDDRNLTYQYVMANESNLDIIDDDRLNDDDHIDNALGLEQDDEQIKRKELEKKKNENK